MSWTVNSVFVHICSKMVCSRKTGTMMSQRGRVKEATRAYTRNSGGDFTNENEPCNEVCVAYAMMNESTIMAASNT